MYKTHGRLKPASGIEVATFKDRYFKCEKCKKTVLLAHVQFAEQEMCEECGGNLYEINPYKGQPK